MKQNLIKKTFEEAVSGLNEVIFADKDLWYSYVLNLPKHLQVTYTVIVFDKQIWNGGFHQYFFNAYGQFAYITVDNLELIGAFKMADFLNKALEKVNKENYDLDYFRELIFYRRLERITDSDEELETFLAELNKRYDSCEDNLEELLGGYLEKIKD
jgi:hypothetical protein